MTDNEGVADGDEEGAVGNATGTDGGEENTVGDTTGGESEERAAAESTATDDGTEGTSVDGDAPADDGEEGADGDGAGADVDDTDADTAADDAEPQDVEADDTELEDSRARGVEEDDGREVEEPTAVDERDELVERVAETDPEELADELAVLRDRVESLEAERDDLESRLKRKQAEFQNYKKRQEKRREEERQRATEDLVERLLDVRDNLQRALETDEDADIRSGVETTMRLFDRVLDGENVERIDPEPGEEVDPQRHEVLMRVESDREPGTVDELHRPGYEMAGKLLRGAQVTVAEETDD
jgi:molecular chaperone GrpE